MPSRKPRHIRQVDAARALGIDRSSIPYHVARGNLVLETVAGVRFVTTASLARLLKRRKAATEGAS